MVQQKTLKKSVGDFMTTEEENFLTGGKPLDKIDIAFENVGIRMNEKYVFKNLSFKIAQGDTFWIVGRNGTGKTTVTNLLTRLYVHDEGKILVNGCGIDKYSVTDLREKIRVVNQVPLFMNGTLEENITLFGKNKGQMWDDIQKDDFMAQLLENLPSKLSSEMNEKRIELSLGQQKVLSLIRVALQNPSAVIMDEYFSNLDDSTVEYSQYLMAKYFGGKTVIQITHDLGEITNPVNVVNLNDFGDQLLVPAEG